MTVKSLSDLVKDHDMIYAKEVSVYFLKVLLFKIDRPDLCKQVSDSFP